MRRARHCPPLRHPAHNLWPDVAQRTDAMGQASRDNASRHAPHHRREFVLNNDLPPRPRALPRPHVYHRLPCRLAPLPTRLRRNFGPPNGTTRLRPDGRNFPARPGSAPVRTRALYDRLSCDSRREQSIPVRVPIFPLPSPPAPGAAPACADARQCSTPARVAAVCASSELSTMSRIWFTTSPKD
jgi:hypothetical protein